MTKHCKNSRTAVLTGTLVAAFLLTAGIGSVAAQPSATPGATFEEMPLSIARVAPAFEGDALYLIDIDERGQISNIRFVRFENLVNTTPEIEAQFQAQALDYIKNRLRFRPARKDGVATASSNIPVRVRSRCKEGVTNC